MECYIYSSLNKINSKPTGFLGILSSSWLFGDFENIETEWLLRTHPLIPVCWHKPMEGWFKLNSDGAKSGEGRRRWFDLWIPWQLGERVYEEYWSGNWHLLVSHNFDWLLYSHTKREDNSLAHSLVRDVLGILDFLVWIENVHALPQFHSIVQADLDG